MDFQRCFFSKDAGYCHLVDVLSPVELDLGIPPPLETDGLSIRGNGKVESKEDFRICLFPLGMVPLSICFTQANSLMEELNSLLFSLLLVVVRGGDCVSSPPLLGAESPLFTLRLNKEVVLSVYSVLADPLDCNRRIMESWEKILSTLVDTTCS